MPNASTNNASTTVLIIKALIEVAGGGAMVPFISNQPKANCAWIFPQPHGFCNEIPSSAFNVLFFIIDTRKPFVARVRGRMNVKFEQDKSNEHCAYHFKKRFPERG